MKAFAINIVRALVMLFVLSWGGGAHAVEFFSSLPDLPMPEHAEELPEESVVFDKLGGRYIESVGRSDRLTPEEVRLYYMSILPQLGWQKSGSREFLKEGELLIVTAWRHNEDTYFSLRLMPQKE